MTEPGHELMAFDETLEEGPLPLPGDPDAQRDVVEHRFVHGLLRAMHSAEAPGREGRVQAILAGVAATEQRAASRSRRHRGLLLASVVLVAATLLAVWQWRQPPLTLGAVVDGVQHSQGVFHTRYYHVTVSVVGRDGAHTERHACDITLGPDRQFLLVGDALFGSYRIGFDGRELWCLPPFERNRWARPVAEGSELEQLVERLPLCRADLDLGSMLERLQARTEHVSVQVLAAEDGDRVQRVVARDLGRVRGAELRALRFDVEPATGLIRAAELHTDRLFARDRVIRFSLTDADDAASKQPNLERYQRPW